MNLAALVLSAVVVGASSAPETWFHVIGGNASKEGIVADLDAIAEAGISGIQFFHGNADGKDWPGVVKPIPCLSTNWEELVRFTADECHKRGLTFKMQNCPGWSMSGGPWITPDKAMRKLVCFEPGKRPKFDKDDDYHEIGPVTFPWVSVIQDGGVAAVTFPNPQQINHRRAYEPEADLVVYENDEEVFRRACPQGAWQDEVGMTFRLPRRIGCIRDGKRPQLRAEIQSRSEGVRPVDVRYHGETAFLDNWEAKAGWGLRAFSMSTNTVPVLDPYCTKTLVFGHVNAKRRNHPAPPEGTGWECDKMDPRGFEANFAGYLGKLLKAGVKIDGTLVDSWECGVQTWTWKMEEEFEKRTGYALRPWLPALFGHVLNSEAETEKFLLDWRDVCSRLVEENYYGTIARLAHEHGMTAQYETAFGDVIVGDILRYWKYADEPMCEFWSPHDDARGFVGSHDFKPVLPCVSAAHLYGKRRVSAEALTSFELTFDENFKDWKKIVDRHFGRGVTHIVFHTYTHNPVTNGKPPSTSFGGSIGSPFLRKQTWWPYLKEFTKYLALCGRELERGQPAVDILMYLGDDVNHKPSERNLLFDNRYKYDYCNADALKYFTAEAGRLVRRDSRFRPHDSLNYRVLWVPKGTFLTSETEQRIEALSEKGARVVRGDFTPDWQSPLQELVGLDGRDVHWYQRHDGEEDVFFVAWTNGVSRLMYCKDGRLTSVMDPVTGQKDTSDLWERKNETRAITPTEARRYHAWATHRTYGYEFTAAEGEEDFVLSLGDVCDWATVWVNGQEVSRLWCEPYACEIGKAVRPGRNDVRIHVTSTWYNTLVHDASLPAPERTTWTKCGPKAGAPFHPAGLQGPIRLVLRK